MVGVRSMCYSCNNLVKRQSIIMSLSVNVQCFNLLDVFACCIVVRVDYRVTAFNLAAGFKLIYLKNYRNNTCMLYVTKWNQVRFIWIEHTELPQDACGIFQCNFIHNYSIYYWIQTIKKWHWLEPRSIVRQPISTQRRRQWGGGRGPGPPGENLPPAKGGGQEFFLQYKQKFIGHVWRK